MIKKTLPLSPVIYAKLRYKQSRGVFPDLKNPVTFDEKLLWLMLYWRNPLKTLCADKYEMRSFVEKHNYKNLLPHLYGVYVKPDNIDFSKLPSKFVIKCTHGCGFNLICTDKSTFCYDHARTKLSAWLATDFSKVLGEIHYSAMRPRIIVEEFLDDLGADLPCDYKIYCFGGEVHCTMACTGRGVNGRANYDFYDREWKTKLPYSRSAQLASRDIPKPDAYDEMLEAAEVLSRPFPFVRMDFYSIRGKAVLGEMTFTPNGCIDLGYTDDAQHKLGAKIILPSKYP